MTSITIKYTSLFLLVLVAGMSATSLSFAQVSVSPGDGSNTPPTNPSIPVTVTPGASGVINFTSITDDFDGFDDLQIIFTVPNESPFSGFVFTGTTFVFDQDTNSYLLTVTSSPVSFDVPSDTSPLTTSFDYTVTDRGTNNTGNTGPVGSGLESSGVINLTILSDQPSINTDPLGGRPVTYNIDTSVLQADGTQNVVFPASDFLSKAYPDSLLASLGLTAADRDDMVLTTPHTPFTPNVDFIFVSGISFASPQTVGTESYTLTLTDESRSFPIGVTLNNDNHDRDSGNRLSVTFILSPGSVAPSDPPCEVTIEENVDFGILRNGDVTNTVMFDNRLNLINRGMLNVSSIMISAGDWVNSTNFVAMNAEQTTWSKDISASPDDRIAFTDTLAVIPDSDITAGGNNDRLRVFLQLTVDLIDVSFRGLTTQQVTVSSICPE